jgi:tetratricopeptide (TPR) repeat protein
MTAIKQNPTHSSLFFPLIELLAREKNTEQLYTIAKQAYEQTGEPLPLKIAGSYAITVGDHQNACTFLTQVFEQTHDKESLELLLVSLFSLHNYQTILQLATSIDANTRYEATTYYIIAQAYYNLNQPKEAKQWAERGKSLYPNDPNLLYALGIAQLANHNPQSALLPLTHALKIIRDPEILLSLGICHFELQNTDEAMKLFLEYCDKKQNPQTCSNLATITLSKGYPELAKLLVKKALQIDPRYPLTPTLKELL